MILWFFIGFLFFNSNLYGYIDPGTGSFIIQMLIAGFVGGVYALKVFWKQASGYFNGILSRRK